MTDKKKFGKVSSGSVNASKYFKDGVEIENIVTVEAPTGAGIGLIAGGYNSGSLNDIQKIDIDTTSNSIDYGDLTAAAYGKTSFGNYTRAVFVGGDGDATGISSKLFSDSGNSVNFGTLSLSASQPMGASNSVKGLVGDTPNNSKNITELVLSTGANSTYGESLSSTGWAGSGCGSSTHAYFYGNTSNAQVLEKFQYSTASINSINVSAIFTGNSRLSAAASGNDTGLFAGGQSIVSNIRKLDLTTDTPTDNFGTLTSARGGLTGSSSSTRAVWSGGETNSSVIDYSTIATGGAATSFGSLITASQYPSGCSDSHGGL